MQINYIFIYLDWWVVAFLFKTIQIYYQFWKSEVLYRSLWAKIRLSRRNYPAYSGCWHNSVPCGGRTVSCLFAGCFSWGSFPAHRGHCCILWLRLPSSSKPETLGGITFILHICAPPSVSFLDEWAVIVVCFWLGQICTHTPRRQLFLGTVLVVTVWRVECYWHLWGRGWRYAAHHLIIHRTAPLSEWSGLRASTARSKNPSLDFWNYSCLSYIWYFKNI